ncbi:GapS4a family protein [Aeromonas caviae]|uniref:GapS4a family protein n=1 Tax=Aeromonas caviae TaxID=648 RepID=UPI000DA28AE0|nr:hypothetical protein [Aeromonas caviae]MBS4634845.1 hypothetical protein [Aeromonas caviae]WQD87807.1 hypothetical protein U0022_13745 [Aeromonas caviae]SQH60280.1 Uncharacterised protein [Aeromonas caviae]
MAGERSKTIGEVGEKIADKFFSRIGWNSPQKGMYYTCYNPNAHALPEAKGGEKKQHGIDFQYSYKSSLESNTLNNLIISIKHIKDSKYPQSATEKFKGYIRDLVHTTECFQRSAERRDINSAFKGCTQINDIPVLFFISSLDDDDTDFVTRLQSSRFISEHDVKQLYVIDNKKVTFILKTIDFIEYTYQDWEWYFYHPLTGLNLNDNTIVLHSNKLQVEYLTSPIIPFLLKKKVGEHDTFKFIVSTINGFSEDNFSKLITYCRDNTLDHVSDFEVLTPDYFSDDHDAIKRKVLSSFETSINISIKNYLPTFRSLANE